jgi:hypothetical protein
MLALVKFFGVAVMLLAFGVGLGLAGVACLREGDTSTGVVLLLFAGLCGLAIAGNAFELLERRRPAQGAAAPVAVRPTLPPGTPSNMGDTPDAVFVTRHGSATGYHFTDKLTPDGVLAGYRHDDFAPGFVQAYGLVAPQELVERVFACVRSPEFAALPDRIADPRIHDGYVLRVTARVARKERVIWLANTTDPLLSPLVAAILAARPVGADRP